MARADRLRNPPIKEALVDLRIASETAVDRKVFESLKSCFSDWKWEERHRFEGTIAAVGGGKPPNVTARDVGFYGFFLKNNDESRIVQIRPDGMTVSQLKGYTTADDLFRETFTFWEAYVGVVQPTAVMRVALRYINELQLRFRPGEQFERFLTAPANMPAGTPQFVSQFLIRSVVHPEDAPGVTGIVTQRLQAANDEVASFVLDIDVFRQEVLTTESHTLEAILQSLREFKNRMFFAFVTDDALEPYR